jgi:excinuclease ABC subunit C
VNYITRNEYYERIDSIKSILSGKTKTVIEKLSMDMEKFSENQNYELALDLKNKIDSLTNLKERQNMERQKVYDEDIINYIIKDNKVYLILFNIYKGTLANKNEFVFDYIDGFFEDFIKQYYSENKIPKEIIIPHKILDNTIDDYLEKKRGSKVKLNIPLIGEKKKLLNLVEKNIELSFFRNLKKMEHLKEKLKLPTIPHVIECFDISHLSGTSTVASMVQFREGRPDKNNYRRFRIRTVDGIDDFSSMAEVINRRYTRLKKESYENEDGLQDTSVFPDLIIIDGGKGQLSSALSELQKIGEKIPIISIAKRDEEIYFPGLKIPVKLSKKEPALQFIQEIRDEAHRFAIKYNRLLRSKRLVNEEF